MRHLDSSGAGPMPRRTVLAGLASLGTGLLISRRASAGQAKTAPFRIDVHNHLAPPGYVAELKPKGLIAPATLAWSVEKSLEDMDRAGVATSITTVSPPGFWFGDVALSRKLARVSNEFAARLMADHPGRYGMFVNLPMPDVDATLKEIEYGLDALKADGVCFFTNYGDKWLGDPAFGPVFEELNRRKAVIYTHPLSANCCRNVLPDIADSNIEWGTDTTRAITRMVFSGSAGKYPNIRVIFSHAGGTMPFLVERFVNLAKTEPFAKILPDGFIPVAQKFYYDTAQTSNPAAMSALKKVVPVAQIVFGTDYPFRNAPEHVQGLKQCGVFSAKELREIDRDNATRLLPRFKA